MTATVDQSPPNNITHVLPPPLLNLQKIRNLAEMKSCMTFQQQYENVCAQILQLTSVNQCAKLRAIFDRLAEQNPLWENNKSLFLDFRDKSGNTPLLIACRMGHVEVVDLLIELGVDMERKRQCKGAQGVFSFLGIGLNEHQYTPIQVAEFYTHEAIVIVLRKAADARSSCGNQNGSRPCRRRLQV